jgi:hypothetical protein
MEFSEDKVQEEHLLLNNINSITIIMPKQPKFRGSSKSFNNSRTLYYCSCSYGFTGLANINILFTFFSLRTTLSGLHNIVETLCFLRYFLACTSFSGYAKLSGCTFF